MRNDSALGNQNGVVLVLSIFMLALLSMIGMASMMLGTSEIEISAGEKHHKVAFYQAESGLSIAAEIIEQLDGYESVSDNFLFDDNSTIEVVDGDFLFESKEVSQATGIWDKDNQTQDSVNIKKRGQSGESMYPYLASGSTPDIVVRYYTDDSQTNYSIDMSVDVDKVGVRHVVGGGAEFGAGSQGIGVASHRVIYNLDCIATLPGSNRNPQNHILGYQLLPR